MQDTGIIKAIEAHAQQFGLTLQTIGQLSVGNRFAYVRLKKGSAHIDTERRVRAWLASDREARLKAKAKRGAA